MISRLVFRAGTNARLRPAELAVADSANSASAGESHCVEDEEESESGPEACLS
jgi:hypothetical protein